MRRDALAAIEGLYRARYAVFLRVATAICGDAALAEDVVHESFVRAVRHRADLRDPAALEPWMWRILVNEARKRRAAEQRLVRVAEETHERAATNGDHGRVRALIAVLPDRQRHALFLRYYADLDYEAIAAALGISAGTVAATLHAAREALRTQLTEVER
ncbi:MAG: sigma-70 family RNA polymerase sigma factor [Thermoleophilia bacterium]|nr:sigma-70 family RNA polymerase sigma factor [Thermoleophilia bacterium]